MSRALLPVGLCVFALFLGSTAAPRPAGATAKFGDAEFYCVGDKQKAASRYSGSTLEAWAAWETSQDSGKRDTMLTREGAKLAETFAEAEAASLAAEVDCVEQTVDAAELEGRIALGVSIANTS
jgi:hypothetical protein